MRSSLTISWRPKRRVSFPNNGDRARGTDRSKRIARLSHRVYVCQRQQFQHDAIANRRPGAERYHYYGPGTARTGNVGTTSLKSVSKPNRSLKRKF